MSSEINPEKRRLVQDFGDIWNSQFRIYNFGDAAIPIPNGIPLRGLLFGIGAGVLTLASNELPLTEELMKHIPWQAELPLPIAIGILSEKEQEGVSMPRYALIASGYTGRPHVESAHRPMLPQGKSIGNGGGLLISSDSNLSEIKPGKVTTPKDSALLTFEHPVLIEKKKRGKKQQYDIYPVGHIWEGTTTQKLTMSPGEQAYLHLPKRKKDKNEK